MAAAGSAGDDGRRLLEAEALADPTRLRVFEGLESASEPLGVAELTDIAGVHHTAVRQHLTKLRDAGLVDEATDTPRGRGRPRLLYSVARARRRRSEAEHFRRLASLLAEAVRLTQPPREVGRRAGVAAALDAVAGSDPPPDAVTLLVEESARMGFEPRLEPLEAGRSDVVLQHCPFADVAAEDPETVCALHLGMAEGVAETTGEVEVRGMTVVDPLSAGCRLHLETVHETQPDPPHRRT